MVFGRRRAGSIVLFIAGQVRRGISECAFRLDGYLNIQEPLMLTAPLVNPGVGHRVINRWNPIVYLVDAATWNRNEVNCTVTSWRYQLADKTYTTNVTFPDADSVANSTEVAIEGLFEAEGSKLLIDSYSADKAVAISDSLYGRPIEVFLSCNQNAVVAEEDSCVLFNLNFTNASPEPNMALLEDALYRFREPAAPGVVMPAAGALSPGDVWLNEDNPIVNKDGSTPEVGCNGDISDYLGEDGGWYHYYTGKNGARYNLTHTFYAAHFDALMAAKIQAPWSPNLEHTLYNRFVRMLIYCNNINNRQRGYVYFKVGDGSPMFDLSADDYDAILSGKNGAAAAGAGARRLGLVAALLSFAAAGVVSLALTAAAAP